MNDLERKEALERELARREASKKSTSERQAAYLIGGGREEPAEDRDVVDLRVTVRRGRERDHGVWGDDDGERPELDADRTSRRQAHAVTRGASSRGDSDA